jgi:hypothetical protein
VKNPDGEPPIQSPPSLRQQRSLFAGVVFGALVGLPLGAVAGAACCLLIRGDLIRPDIATLIGIVYGLLPALLILLGGMGIVRGKSSGYLLIGSVFVCPMIGLLIGGILDRAFEAALTKSRSAALLFGIMGVAACGGLVYGIDTAAYGPEPKEVVREARAIILTEWENKPELQKATIQKMTLVRTGRRTYTGFVEATIDGQLEQLAIEIVVEERTLSLRLTPANK